MSVRQATYKAIDKERDYQDKKWGTNKHKSHEWWMTVLGEEYGEACRAVCNGDDENLRDELIQVASVAVKILERLELMETQCTYTR